MIRVKNKRLVALTRALCIRNQISKRAGHRISAAAKHSRSDRWGLNQKSCAYVRVIRAPVPGCAPSTRTRLGYRSLWCTLTEQNTMI